MAAKRGEAIRTIWGLVTLTDWTPRPRRKSFKISDTIRTIWGTVRQCRKVNSQHTFENYEKQRVQRLSPYKTRQKYFRKRTVNTNTGRHRCPACHQKDSNISKQNGVCFDCWCQGFGMLVPTGTIWAEKHHQNVEFMFGDGVADNISRAYEEAMTMIESA